MHAMRKRAASAQFAKAGVPPLHPHGLGGSIARCWRKAPRPVGGEATGEVPRHGLAPLTASGYMSHASRTAAATSALARYAGADRGRRRLGRRHSEFLRRAVSATGGCSSGRRSPRDRAARGPITGLAAGCDHMVVRRPKAHLSVEGQSSSPEGVAVPSGALGHADVCPRVAECRGPTGLRCRGRTARGVPARRYVRGSEGGSGLGRSVTRARGGAEDHAVDIGMSQAQGECQLTTRRDSHDGGAVRRAASPRSATPSTRERPRRRTVSWAANPADRTSGSTRAAAAFRPRCRCVPMINSRRQIERLKIRTPRGQQLTVTGEHDRLRRFRGDIGRDAVCRRRSRTSR